MERWAPVVGYEGHLEVSDRGRVRSLPSVRVSVRLGNKNVQRRAGCIFAASTGANGYREIAPKYGKIRKKLHIHRLVARAFVPGYFDGAHVNHINGDKADNTAGNLEWVTIAENTAHQWRIGLVNLRGENHPSHKLSDNDVIEIMSALKRGERASTLARQYEVSDALIYKIRRGTKRIHASTSPSA